ncbi:putative lipid II flippase FtsW [Xanthobacter tagetidis]|uniref:Probable peptidoglycan glycosyltransferase FtsW n=1 Tax=Xanthobacter tagetidis TaxID=60216 RepID=A0A3L7A4Y5_9HYPH|nr:putative lipid II flippase FtsW [Xanthobacter tagetidis]MBB6308689.1 cell division protein FtsW [Xanthobacter tagetidis]RLP75403.1 putative lipid II flippase FtsW [Xanthobacter tagetidis]
MMSRADRTVLSEWWWTVDRALLAALFGLMIIGIILSLAASPAVTARIGIDDPFHFVNRQLLFLVPAVCVLLATSFLTPRALRRTAIGVFALFFVLLLATLVFGPEVKGARRWLTVAGITVQPSEFIKPAFVILAAWLFAESSKRPEMPAQSLAMLLLASVLVPLVMQPDFGQSLLICLVWGALFFLAGLRWIWMVGLAGAGVGAGVIAYLSVSHVQKRISRFINPDSGDTYQIEAALNSFRNGGWFGTGPGEGTVKRMLPDGHTDFVFAVAGEEFGIILNLIILALFAFIILRSLRRAMDESDPFARFAITGLTLLFGLQASINMAVNVHIAPAKGMTLPFISYGGSSLISLAFGMGMLIALSRKRPGAAALAALSEPRRKVEPQGTPTATPTAGPQPVPAAS